MALGAGDADLAFALGNGEHLAAVGALEIGRGLAAFHIFLAVRLARSKSSLLVPAAREALAAAAPAAQASYKFAQAGYVCSRGDKGLVLLVTCVDIFGQAAQHANHDDGDGNPAEPLDAGYRSRSSR